MEPPLPIDAEVDRKIICSFVNAQNLFSCVNVHNPAGVYNVHFHV